MYLAQTSDNFFPPNARLAQNAKKSQPAVPEQACAVCAKLRLLIRSASAGNGQRRGHKRLAGVVQWQEVVGCAGGDYVDCRDVLRPRA